MIEKNRGVGFSGGNGAVIARIPPYAITVEDALKKLNIKAAFFDAETLSFGEVTQLTKTTDEDFCADVQPHAAYDSESGREVTEPWMRYASVIDERMPFSAAVSDRSAKKFFSVRTS